MSTPDNRSSLFPVLAPVAQKVVALPVLQIATKGSLICGVMCWLICVTLAQNAAFQMRGILGVLPPLEIAAMFALFLLVMR